MDVASQPADAWLRLRPVAPCRSPGDPAACARLLLASKSRWPARRMRTVRS